MLRAKPLLRELHAILFRRAQSWWRNEWRSEIVQVEQTSLSTRRKNRVREGQEVESSSLLSAAEWASQRVGFILSCISAWQCVIFDEMFYVGPPALFAKRDALMLLELHSLGETTIGIQIIIIGAMDIKTGGIIIINKYTNKIFNAIANTLFKFNSRQQITTNF